MAEHVTDVRKSGEWYRVTGVSDGKRVSVDVPASYVEGTSRGDAHTTFGRALRNARDHT